MRQLIKYPGSKWSLSKWITSMFPEHHSYLDAFFGSGAILFNKVPSPIEINDLDDNVINLFEVIKSDPERLAFEISLIPYARDVFTNAWQNQNDKDPVVRAAKFCVRCDMGQGFRTTGESTGFKMDIQGREDSYAVKHWNKVPDLIIECAARLKQVQIENRDAKSIIKRFKHPNVLIYADPPYVLSTRHGKQYAVEMDDNDHIDLIDALKDHPGPVILSGYESNLYKQMLPSWNTATNTYADQRGKRRNEIIWMNFEPSGYQLELSI